MITGACSSFPFPTTTPTAGAGSFIVFVGGLTVS